MLRSKPEKGDVIFSNIGTLGSTVLVDQDFEFSIKNVALFKPLTPELSSFLYLYLSRLETLEYMIDKSSGTSQKFFSLEFLRRMKIIIPPQSVLKTFASIVISALSERSKLHILNLELCLIRDLLIPQLVTGKRELK
ncbi:MAG: restriction endonuclease subunit S, partial [Pseudorhodobacter sp.]|nr:restriction endonuclease subunit S [Pseudorhodobacter sp.]